MLDQSLLSAASSSSSTSSSISSSSFSTWLSDNIADFSGYLISFVVLTAIAVGISWYCWPERTKKVLRGCCCGSLHGCMWLLNKARKKAGGKRGRKGDASGSDSDSDSDGGSDQDENGEGKGGKSKGKKGGSKGKHESSDSDDDVGLAGLSHVAHSTCYVCLCIAIFHRLPVLILWLSP